MQLRHFLYLLLPLLLLPLLPAWAQDSFVLSGRVLDARTDEPLAGASISLKERPSIGTVSEPDSRYSLSAPAGSYTLVIRYIGYNNQEVSLQLFRNETLVIRLEQASYNTREVEVIGTRIKPITQTARMGELDIPMTSVKTLPVLFGETDIMKTVQLMPGVQSGGEGNTGFYVRGGGADQNLVQLDQAVVYNPGHLLNFFSVFNSDAISNATLIKGNMPARYGGRLSSVLDVELREGSKDSLQAEGGIGLIASRLTVQGPLVKDKASFIFSARRTYVDVLFGPFLRNTEQGGVPYYFYDFNGKLSYTLSPKDKLYLSGYYGKDVGSLTLSSGRFVADFQWGNAAATARWNHQFSDKHFVDVTGTLSDYAFDFNWDFGDITTSVETGVRDYTLKTDFVYAPSVRHELQYGLHYTHHTLRPRTGSAETAEGDVFSTDRILSKTAHEAAVYLSDDWNVTDRLLLSLGIRGSYFAQMGPFTFYTFDQNERPVDSVAYAAGERVKTFQALEPRVSLRYSLGADASVKASYARSAQYLHLVSNAYTTLPLDVWVPSSAIVEPQRATQYAVGYFQSFRQNMYEGSVELYYKTMENQLEFREGFVAGPSNRDLEYEFVRGSGESYGAEFFLRRNYGDLQGWLGYTLSWTDRTFPAINQGRTFPARFDRRHDLSLVATYKYNPRWTFGGSFVYGTGQATTMPERRYLIEGTVNYQYGDRNGFRMEPFHRLDLSATLEGKAKRRLQSSWTFAIYNVYGRRNPFLYFIDSEGAPYSTETRVQAKKVSLIPIPLPSATWNFKW
ncbi:TonB-dependent receptor [Pontibacter sp. FD36]|uniref:TonB-dependent receptor n=1 Tax=Pontibacter sp. FD36 TaxID=2789860 RepID=UPI0018A9A324|nr:TonB-dependent receptor [Pontibacter sp. FD36]MBF8962379.1 TonB-dependent receptor [Pontibacter sp. FD36]